MKLTCCLSSLLIASILPFGCTKSETDSAKTRDVSKAEQQQPKQPLVQPPKIVDWCKEHGVPESVCTRCNASLIADFKAKGDWCNEHGLPESQCIACHPELKAKFEAMAPKP